MDLETKVNVPDDLKKWLDCEPPTAEEYSTQLKRYMFEKGCMDALIGTVDVKLLSICAEYFVGNSYAKSISSSITNYAIKLYPDVCRPVEPVPPGVKINFTGMDA